MSTGAAEVEAILAKVAGDVAPVRSEWVGVAQTRFNALWDQLQQDASGFQSILVGIAELTQNAATAYEVTEQYIAKSFNDFRIEPAASGSLSGQVPLSPTTTCEDPVSVESTVVTEVDIDLVDLNVVDVDLDEELLNESNKSVDPSKGGSRSPRDRSVTSNGRRK